MARRLGRLWALDAMLAAHDCQTELYTSAEQLLNTVPASMAAWPVVDINLGGISGIEMARHLAARGFGIPLIFMSGCKDEIVLHQAAEPGCPQFLQKPFPASELIDAIAKVSGRPLKPTVTEQR